MTSTQLTTALNIVSQRTTFPTVSLVEPSTSSYLLLTAEIDSRAAFLPSSRRKKRLIVRCKELCRQLSSVAGLEDASVFNAILVPPGRGAFLLQRLGQVHVARFDLAVLLECASQAALDELLVHDACKTLVDEIAVQASFVHNVTASNVRRIAPVDHSRQGVFLFNYFFADRVEQNLAVWNYTAGWFQAETGLDNSTVLLPSQRAASNYSLINHCRWDSLVQVLPSLIFKRSFRSYVLDNFAANNVAAMPVLYRLA